MSPNPSATESEAASPTPSAVESDVAASDTDATDVIIGAVLAVLGGGAYWLMQRRNASSQS